MGFTLNQLEQERQIRKLQKKEDKDTKDYEKLSNLPKVNNVELKGDKTTSDLGINADNVMMSDGVTSVADAVDELKSGLTNQKYVKIEENVALTDTIATVTIQSIANMDMLIFYPKVSSTIRGSLILPYEIFTRHVDCYIPINIGGNAGAVYIRYVSDTSISVMSTLSNCNYMEIWGNS